MSNKYTKNGYYYLTVNQLVNIVRNERKKLAKNWELIMQSEENKRLSDTDFRYFFVFLISMTVVLDAIPTIQKFVAWGHPDFI